MAEKPLRVRLDLSETDIHPYKYVWFPVYSHNLKTIEDFKSTLYEKFNIEKGIKLYVQDSLLLGQETILLLRENDTVKILYEDQCPSTNYGSLQKTSTKRSNVEFDENKNLFSVKKQKKFHSSQTSLGVNPNLSAENNEPWSIYYDAEDTTELVSKKKKKCKKSHESSNLERQSCSSMQYEDATFNINVTKRSETLNGEKPNSDESKTEMSPIQRSKKEKNVMSDNLNSESDINTEICQILPFEENLNNDAGCEDRASVSTTFTKECDPVQEVNVIQGSSCHKNKRKRHKKRKFSGNLSSSLACSDTLSKLSDHSEMLKDIVPHSSLRKHIRFTDQPETLDSCAEDESIKPIVVNIDSYLERLKVNNCHKKSLHPKENGFSASSNENTCSTEISTPKNKIGKTLEGWNVTPIGNYPAEKSSPKNHVVGNFANLPVNKMLTYSELSSLQCIPVAGTRIAFKVLELSNSYCPEVSEYKEGIVKSIDPCTDKVEIELLKEEIKCGKEGKFENLYPDETPQMEVIRNMKLSWAEIIEPKLMTC